MEIGIKFMELFKVKIENLVISTILPIFHNVMKKKSPSENEVLYAICLFDTFLDLASEEKFNLGWKNIAQMMMPYC